MSLHDSCQVCLLAPKAYLLSGAHLKGLLMSFMRSFWRASWTSWNFPNKNNFRKSLSEKSTLFASTLYVRVVHFCIKFVNCNNYWIQVRKYIPEWNPSLRWRFVICVVKNIDTCHTVISSGDYCLLIFWSLLVDLSFNVLIKNVKDTEREGQKGHFRGLSKPWLAQASLWLA